LRPAAAVLLCVLAFPTEAIAGPEQVTIAGRVVANPTAYEPLLEDLPRATSPPATARSVEIVLRDEAGGVERLDYFPLDEVVLRRGAWLRVPDELADRIEEELEDQAAEGRSLWPAYLSLFALLGAGGTILWLMWGRRRWRARAT
jgi:hypothetical protein